MIEEIAIQYANLSETIIRLIGFGFVFLGALIATLANGGDGKLGRSPFFAYVGFAILFLSITQLAWLNLWPAFSGGYLWVLMLVDIGAGLMAGYFLGIVAAARSRDAFGHGRAAFLIFVPVANLFLLFAPSLTIEVTQSTSTEHIFSGGRGVLFGLVALAGVAAIRAQLEGQVQQETSGAQSQQASVEFMIRANGLESGLQTVASKMTVGRVDELTEVTDISVDGSTLRMTFMASGEAAGLREVLRDQLVSNTCNKRALQPFLESGATFEYLYLREDQSVIGVVSISKNSCI